MEVLPNGSSAQSVIQIIRGHEYVVTDPISPTIPAGSKEFGDILCIPIELVTE